MNTQKLNILVVEDSVRDIENAHRSLGQHNLTICSNFLDAITLLGDRETCPVKFGLNIGKRKNRFDVVFIDAEFPSSPNGELGLFGPLVALHALSVGVDKLALMVPVSMEYSPTKPVSQWGFYLKEPGFARLCSGMSIAGKYSNVTFLVSNAFQVFKKDTWNLLGEVEVDVQANCLHSGLKYTQEWQVREDRSGAECLKHWNLTLQQLLGEKRIHTEMQSFSVRREG
jgi:CheY-like chemotaxis protein